MPDMQDKATYAPNYSSGGLHYMSDNKSTPSVVAVDIRVETKYDPKRQDGNPWHYRLTMPTDKSFGIFLKAIGLTEYENSRYYEGRSDFYPSAEMASTEGAKEAEQLVKRFGEYLKSFAQQMSYVLTIKV